MNLLAPRPIVHITINTNKKTRIVIFRNNDSTFNDVLLGCHYLIQDTFNYVRENVRLYNYCGLVTTVYFVFFRDYLGLYG